jgi:hypothetical protein
VFGKMKEYYCDAIVGRNRGWKQKILNEWEDIETEWAELIASKEGGR